MYDTNLVVDRPEITGFGAPVAAYSSIVGVRGGKILFVAGKGPVDENGNTISDDIESQIHQAMKNMIIMVRCRRIRRRCRMILMSPVSTRCRFPMLCRQF